MKKIIPIIVIIMSSTAVLSAQDFRYDAGIAGGISCYMGDANQVSPWHRPGAAISGVFRFLLNYRWAVKTDISAMQFSGYSTVGGGYVSFDASLGAGVKYKIAPRWNISLEFAMHKTLGDSFDGKALADPYHIESSVLKNTDWFSTTLFSITYEFGRKKEICNNDNR